MTTTRAAARPERGATPPSTGTTRQLRLTARGRLVVFGASLVASLGTALVSLSGASVATQHAGVPTPARVVMVHDGDTLWSLAAQLTDEGEDVRDTMTRIERLNGLGSPVVYAGQRLRVPGG